MTTQTQPLPLQAQSEGLAPIPWIGRLGGIVLLIVLTVLVAELDRAIANAFRSSGVAQNPLEYPLTAVVIGLAANVVLRLTRFYRVVKPVIRTELYLKVGLVLLGVRVSLGEVLAIGAGGLIQALIMVTSVFFFTWWVGGKLKLSDTLRAVMSSAVAICGVSAAIAAAGSVSARKEEVTYITALVILIALPLMVLMPVIAQGLALPQNVAGAWFGGNIDTTAAVVGAGTVYGPDAQKVAAVVKGSQNVLIGFVAFGLALYFALVVQKGKGERPTPKLIWQRFPKFVLGFLLVSALVSFGAIPAPLVREINNAYQWAFALAFVCIGLEFSVGEVRRMGWRPMAVYLGATVFNTILALGVSYTIFSILKL